MRRIGIFLSAFGLLIGLLLLAWSAPTRPGRAPSDALRVGTANLSSQNSRPGEASRVLADTDVDILLLQEWTGQNASPPALQDAGLRFVLSDARRGTHGAALLAAPSIVEAAQVVSAPWDGPCSMPMITARIRVGEKRVGLLGVHAPPPVPACWSSRAPYLQSVSALIEEGKTIRQFGVLRSGMPTVLIGDLNALGWELDAMSESGMMSGSGLSDAFDEGSWRLGPTWTPHSWLPALTRIDYVWVPSRWPIEGAWTMALPGSDHRALLTDLEKRYLEKQ